MKTAMTAALALALLAGASSAALAQEQQPGERGGGREGGGHQQAGHQQPGAPQGRGPGAPGPAPGHPPGATPGGGPRGPSAPHAAPPPAMATPPQPIERHAPPAGGQPNIRGDRFQGDRGPGAARFHGDREPGGQGVEPGRTARFGAPQPNSPPTDGRTSRQFAPGDNPYLRTAPPPERGGDRAREFNADRRRGGDVRQQWERGRYPPVYESQRRFRIGAYRAPRGYVYRQWRYGDVVPFDWFATQYLMNDWWDYGLPDPPIDYYWVRVGPDALLIDRFDGRVVQVVRDIFW